VEKLAQVGIQTMNAHQKEQAKKYNVQVIHMGQFDSTMQFDFDGPVYVSIDLDALDPAFAPGVSHPEPGGLSTRDLLTILSTANGEVVGGDIVEYNPKKDFQNTTAVLASKILKELMSKMI
jgi:arginase family enzyme